MLDTCCSSGVENGGHSAHSYFTVAGHYSRLSQPAALTENSASWIQSDPTQSHVFCLDSHDGLSTSEAVFASSSYKRLYEPDLSGLEHTWHELYV